MGGTRVRTSRVASALLVWCISLPAQAADSAHIGIGFSEALGPGAVAILGSSAGAFGNPALIAHASRLEARADGGVDAEGSSWQRFDLVWPTLRGDAVAAGWARSEDAGVLRHRGSGTYARNVGAGFDFGGSVELRTENMAGVRQAGFGVHAGATYAPQGPGGVAFGAVVWNAVHAGDRTAIEPQATRVQAAVARPCRLGHSWTGTPTAGFDAVRGSTGQGWLGARLAWRDRAVLQGAGTAGAARAGASVRIGGARLEYGLESGSGVHHAVGLRLSFGAPVAERRLAAATFSDSVIERRVAQQIAARQQHAVAMRLEAAERAAEQGAFERACELYREALLWRPEDPAALAGLLRAQRGALFVEADSAVARGDWWAAISQLEHATRLFPQDSLAAAKLEEVRGAVHRADRNRGEAADQVRIGLEAYAAQRYAAAARGFEAALRLDPADQTAGEFLQRSRLAHEAQIKAAVAQTRLRLDKRDVAGARAALAPALAEAPLRPEVKRAADQIEREAERQADERRLAEAREKEVAAREDRSPPPVSSRRLQATYDRGMQMFRAGDLAAAMSAWEEVARSAPHYEEVDRYLLRVYRVVGLESYTEGRLQEAIDIWTKAMGLEPDNSQVRRYLDQANAKLQRAQNPRGSR
jgi:tetratricopeptide (TPR) repeat protein